MRIVLPMGFKINFDSVMHIKEIEYLNALQEACDWFNNDSTGKSISVIAINVKNDALKLITPEFFRKLCVIIRNRKADKGLIYLFDPKHISFTISGNLDYAGASNVVSDTGFIHIDSEFGEKNEFNELHFFNDEMRKEISEKAFDI